MEGTLALSSSPSSDEVITSLDGETVADVALRVHGRTSGGVVEALWDRNPGLAALGPRLPGGTAIAVPAAPEAEAAEPVRLWT